MAPQQTPVFLSPALPTELLWHMLHNCAHPSTLIICSTRLEFLSAVSHQIQRRQHPLQPHGPELKEAADGGPGAGPEEGELLPLPDAADARATQLLAAPLYLVAVARHIRVVFIPTVSHLRAYLSVFSVADSKVSQPPPPAHGVSTAPELPSLFIFRFLDMHRDTSEWSVQGLNNTTAILVETARRIKFQLVVTEPRTSADEPMEVILEERVPVLSGSAQRTGPDLAGSGWTGKTVDVHRILKRHFHFQPGAWQLPNSESKKS